jgi:anti-sigma regulatory factor (Ser/Thr protein kinase)
MRSSLALRAGEGATRQARDFVTRFATKCRISDDDAARVMVMLEELLTNLEKYGRDPDGGARLAEITLGLAGSTLTIEFEDDGAPFNPLDRPPPDLDSDVEDRAIGGLGIFHLRELSHEASYDRLAGHNRLRLVRRVRLAGGV